MVPSPDISWTAGFRQDFAKKKTKHPEQGKIVRSAYRPFAKQFLWFDKQTNERTYLQPQLFPYPEAKNLQISIVLGSRQFSCLMTDVVPDIQLSFNAQCFPLYWYEKLDDDSPEKYGLDFYEIRDRADSHGYVRHDAITDTALNVFRAAYPALSITKEDIFYYVYGILHSSEYRRRFANNLTKELPRIPLARNFKAFEQAGRKLAKLHLNYEKVKPWDVTEIGDPTNPGRTVRMTYPRKVKDPDTGKKVADLTVLQVAENLTIENIPLRAYEYQDRHRMANRPVSGHHGQEKRHHERPERLFGRSALHRRPRGEGHSRQRGNRRHHQRTAETRRDRQTRELAAGMELKRAKNGDPANRVPTPHPNL